MALENIDLEGELKGLVAAERACFFFPVITSNQHLLFMLESDFPLKYILLFPPSHS